jgi:hypothetical protein
VSDFVIEIARDVRCPEGQSLDRTSVNASLTSTVARASHFRRTPLSTRLPSAGLNHLHIGPREIFAMNPRFEWCRHRRDILSKAERIRAAASSPVRDGDVMLKKRSRAATTACFSSWLYRIRSSRVMTTQPFALRVARQRLLSPEETVGHGRGCPHRQHGGPRAPSFGPATYR